MNEINENYLDIQKILKGKGVNLPKWAIVMVNRLLHIKEINSVIYRHRDKFGIDFAQAFVREDLQLKVELVGKENIPMEGYPILAGNHPLGGPDGVTLISEVGQYRKDILFPVNDFLMYLPGLKDVFVPIDKVRRNTRNVDALEAAFAGKNMLLYYPAGLCSRKQHGKICDLEWKSTFIKKAIRYQRDVVPIYFDAQNRKRFYALANIRKRLGVKFNFEMALLPAELFAQKGKRLRIVVGQPIPYSTFDNRHTAKEWAAMVKEHVYALAINPQAKFITN